MSSLSSLVSTPRPRAGRMGLGEPREEGRRATTQTGIGVPEGQSREGVRSGALPLVL